MEDMLVKDWMSTNVITVTPDTTLVDARKLMKQHRIRRLPVLNHTGDLIGIVTWGDIREAWPCDTASLLLDLEYFLTKMTVEMAMTRNPITVTPDTRILDAAKLMIDKRISGLPVLEDNRVVGIITESDIFKVALKVCA